MDDPKVKELLTVGDAPIDVSSALERFRASARGARPYRPSPVPTWARALAAAAGIVVLFAGLSLSGLADTIFKIFEPTRVAPVVLTSAELAGLPDLRAYGTLALDAKLATTPVADADAAARLAGFRPLLPSALPAGVPADAHVAVVPAVTGTFVFDAARAAAAAQGRTIPPMPASIDGTTLTGRQGPTTLVSYGAAVDPRTLDPAHPPSLVLARQRAPVVTSNGATLDEVRAYLLAQPGITPGLAAQIRAMGDPAGTLPVIIPMDLASARPVMVHGAAGLLVGDATGLGSAALWVQDGYVNFVAGTLAESQLLQVADSLR